MIANENFDMKVLNISVEELVLDINSLLDDYAPDGKSHTDFTGGYVQQLKNSNQFVAYFGTKIGTNNRDTVKITVEADELDLFYMMLKAKVHNMRQDKAKTVRVSMAQRKLAESNFKVEENKEGIKKPNVFN